MCKKKKIILVTDGDICAKRAIEIAAKNIGARCISKTAGNPTPISCEEIIELINKTEYGPVIVMVDDEGNEGMGAGERIINELSKEPSIEVLGIVVVASNMQQVVGVCPDFSIDSSGNIIEGAVNKFGSSTNDRVLYGDTVDIVGECKIPIVVGIGDIGKMHGRDDSRIGSPIITKALQEIVNRS